MANIDDPTQLLDSWLNELTNMGQPDNLVTPSSVQSSITSDHLLKSRGIKPINNNLNSLNSTNLSIQLDKSLGQGKSPKLPPKPANLLASRRRSSNSAASNNPDTVDNSMGPAKDSAWSPAVNTSHDRTGSKNSDKDDDLEAILGELLELEKQLALETNAVNEIDSHPAPSQAILSHVPFEAAPSQITSQTFPYSYTSIHSKAMDLDGTTIHQQPDHFPPPPAPDDPLLLLLSSSSHFTQIEAETYDCDDGRDSAFSDDLAPSSQGDPPLSKASTKSSSSNSSFFLPGSVLSNRHSHDSQISATNTEAPNLHCSNHIVEKEHDPVDRSREEKIRLALQKLKEANIKKMFVKAYSPDGSAKCVLVEEDKTCGQICALLALKNHMVSDIINWALVEHLPDLMMERILEDHEKLVENISYWTRESANKMLFLKTEEKYEMFNGPNQALTDLSFSSYKQSQNDPSPETTLRDVDSEINVSTHSNNDTLQASAMAKYKEYFISKILQHQKSNTASNVADMEGFLYLKLHKKKVWKKYWCVLRSSGLYFSPKSVKTNASKDLVCLCKFENVNVYYGFGWHKKYKAPTDFGFALKIPQVQVPLSKHTKYFCLENSGALKSWVNGIRIAKYGSVLAENFYEAKNTETLCVSNEVPSLTNLVKSISDVNLASQNTMPSINTHLSAAHDSLAAASLKQSALQKRISLSPSNCSAGYNTSYSSSSGKGSSATNSADLSMLGVIMADPLNPEKSEIHNSLFPNHKLTPEVGGAQSCESAINKTTCTTRSTQPPMPAIQIKKSYPKMPLIGMAASVVASFQNGDEKVRDESRSATLNPIMVTTANTTAPSVKLSSVREIMSSHANEIIHNHLPTAIDNKAHINPVNKMFGGTAHNNNISHKRATPPPVPRRDPNTMLVLGHTDNIYSNSCEMASIVPSTSLRRSSLNCFTTTTVAANHLPLSPNPVSLPVHKFAAKNFLNAPYPKEMNTTLTSASSAPNSNPMSPRFARLPSHQTSPALTMNKMLVEELKRKQEKGSTLHLNNCKSSTRSSPHCANLWAPPPHTNGDLDELDDDFLPPPPPELLEDLSESYYHQPNMCLQNVKPSNNGMPYGQAVKRRVPPPPKRNETTRLSTTCSMILPSLH